jgi:hypothetical protein
MKSESKTFSGTMSLKASRQQTQCLIRRRGEYCVCSEARGGMVEKDSERE